MPAKPLLHRHFESLKERLVLHRLRVIVLQRLPLK